MLRKLKSSQSDIVMKDIGCTGFRIQWKTTIDRAVDLGIWGFYFIF